MDERIDNLLQLIEGEPDGLRTAELLQAHEILQTLVGKAVTGASVEETRIAVETSDGCSYRFYGFLGSEGPSTARAAKSAPT